MMGPISCTDTDRGGGGDNSSYRCENQCGYTTTTSVHKLYGFDLTKKYKVFVPVQKPIIHKVQIREFLAANSTVLYRYKKPIYIFCTGKKVDTEKAEKI